ncbi:MAG TPA: hypothetical protein VKW04_02660 [Planctomycetota bacterium]|nr:hypothetical protein [Planctomycetota bacterium]
MIRRDQLWSVALTGAFLCSVAWIVVPGECVVRPAGTDDTLLPMSLLGGFLHPFSVDEIYVLHFFLKTSPIAIVLLAVLHWKRRFDKLRAATAFYALVLSAAVALYPYRTFSDIQLIAIVGVWGIVVMVAYQSKASPGSALLALMSIQVLMSEVFSGLGPDRGLPFWFLTVGLSIVFSYGIFHYTRMSRHSVLGRFTEIRKIDPAAIARREVLMQQRRRLEERS